MTWDVLIELLGPGLQWDISQQRILDAIAEARRRDRPDVVAHLEIILKRRNAVAFETPLPRLD